MNLTSQQARSLVLHEFSHVLQFRWYGSSSSQAEADSRYAALASQVSIPDGRKVNRMEPLAECMAYGLGAATDKPGGYLSKSLCDPYNPDATVILISEGY